MRVYGSSEQADRGESGLPCRENPEEFQESPPSSSSNISVQANSEPELGEMDVEEAVTQPLLLRGGGGEISKGQARIGSRPTRSEQNGDRKVGCFGGKGPGLGSASMRTAISAVLIFTVVLMGLGYVYNSESVRSVEIGVTRASTEELVAAKPSSASTEEKRDNLYDVCRLNTHSKIKETCPHATTSFLVKADEDGRWPKGFSWTVLKDSLEEDGDGHSKAFLHSEKGEFDAMRAKGRDIQCKNFVTELCLSGTYIVYANSGEHFGTPVEKSMNAVVHHTL